MFQQTIRTPSQTDQMDWYFSSGRDDLVVPQYQESSDQYLSQDYMSQWEEGSSGMTMFGDLPPIDYGASNSEGSVRGGINDWADYQFDGSSGGETDRMNENFLNSLLKEDPSLMETTYHPFGMSTKDLKYLEVPSLFPMLMNGTKLDNKPTGVLSNSEKRKGFRSTKALKCEMEASPDTDGSIDEGTSSFEAATLHELETAMVQLKQETRISFRDALYRLAQNSKQHHLHNQFQGGQHNLNLSNRESPRYGESENKESESSTYENTIAHLMFNNLNCDIRNL